MSERVIGAIDVGGKSIKAGLVADKGLLHIEIPNALPIDPNPDLFFSSLRLTVNALVERAVSQNMSLEGFGIGLPGLVDTTTGTAHFATNLQWQPTNFKEMIQEWTRLPACVEHDVRCGAIAEMAFGALRGEQDFVYVAIGTGIGASIGINGQIYAGFTGYAGELGHTIVHPQGRPCTCGRLGCLEAYCSAKHIELQFLSRTGIHATCEEIGGLVKTGHLIAAEIWDEAMATLAAALVNYATLISPRKIVLGGGVSAAGEQLIIEPVRSHMQRMAPDLVMPEFSLSQLRQHSGVIGAGYQAYGRLGLNVS